ncbi:MAG TPA: adenylate/guanylate cyclase domain-containing protein [Streptosporangiaceae bacterium]
MTGPAQIPTGTVTLLFTDIEGSTRLWEAEQQAMAVALRRHDEILRASIVAAGGYVFKTVGDAFCATFWSAEAALAAVLAAQRLLGDEDWPTSRPVRVRMGVHTGTCEERDGDYFGPVVNRAARLEAAAHGGQVLVSGASAELLSGALPAGASLRDLGLHRLKDLGRPEQVFQLEAGFLPPDFPPLASLDNPELPNNLPSLLSPFVGREPELAEVGGLVRQSRLVTLTGAGGSGKTRLALQGAAELLDSVEDGVWLAELAALTDGDQIPQAVAAALGLPDRDGPGTTASVTHALSAQDALILLDNCEHLIDAAAKFCDHLIRHCPRVRILATSREPLGIDGERVYRVPSLSLPPADADAADQLAASDAVRLFVARAEVQDGGFTLDDQTAPQVVTICRRLDGIPLALELAAARLSSMSLTQVAARLDQRFRLLTGGSRNAMPRQQTLQATVEWSFSLLTPAERDVLTRLSVFAGGFELEAAEHVCATESVDALDVMDLLGWLVDKSLVVADRASGMIRYRLLETIRQYCAGELLRAAGDEQVLQLRDRHAEHYLELARTAESALRDHRQREWFARLDSEWDNLRAAFTHLQAEGRALDVLRLGTALLKFVLSRAHTSVLGAFRYAIATYDTPGPDLAAGLLTMVQLMLLFERSGLMTRATEGSELADRALSMAREIGDRRLEAKALAVLAGFCFMVGDVAGTERQAAESLALARQAGDLDLLGDVLGLAALVGTPDQQLEARQEALDCFRRVGDDLGAAGELSMLYGMELRAGHMSRAEARLTEAVALAEPLGDEVFLFFFLSDLCVLRIIQGDYAAAAPLVRRCLLAAHRTGLETGTAEVLFAAACCAAAEGDRERGARLHGAADAALKAGVADRSLDWSGPEVAAQDREVAALRAAMGDAGFEAACRDGALLSMPDAVALALSRGPRTTVAA